MILEPLLNGRVVNDRLVLAAGGAWTAANARQLERLIEGARASEAGALSLDLREVRALDTYGAWLVERLVRDWQARNLDAEITGLPERYRTLLGGIHTANREALPAPSRESPLVSAVAGLGRRVAGAGHGLVPFLNMLGALGTVTTRALARPYTFRFTSFVHHLDRVGLQAVPIILLITFLIGGIIAQQGIFHFRKFGADVYVVDLVGILVLREIGVLIVAIMVAGRSGSSYTAELGSMKMREEIDALHTMGRDPVEVLILPRVLALVIALPLLTFLGSMAALYGGCLVAWLYGGMAPETFIVRLKEAISLTHFKVGMIKAPFMALVIGIVACAEGLRVKGSAESLGLQTTTSVVKSIFLVIVLDGMFAMFFASIDM
ncbi:MAG: MlaE family lipid ABC transporter permease subunit [Hyphomicrobiaceae bacterium]|nr:MlaE family lipid ABC transporter permease subunit [Hyphomicrobiaceae bacterium]